MKGLLHFMRFFGWFMIALVLTTYFFFPGTLGRDVAKAVKAYKAYNAEVLKP